MRILCAGLALVFVAACSGGGGGGGSVNNPPPVTPPITDADPGGLWSGTASYADITFEELIAITTSDGRFALLSLETFGPDTVGQYIGTASVAGSELTGAGSAYAAAGSTWDDGSTVLDISITATISERNTMAGSWTTSSGETVSFELDYDSSYEKDSSLALVEGTWYVYDDILNPTLTLTVDPGGAFSAQNVQGCQSLGRASIIDAAFSVYDWAVTISGCGIAGDYVGVAVLGDVETDDPANSENNIILVSMSNDQRALLLPLER